MKTPCPVIVRAARRSPVTFRMSYTFNTHCLTHVLHMADKEIDATGLYCPEPVFRTKIELERMGSGSTLKVRADDPAAEDDISKWAMRHGHEILSMKKDGALIEFEIKKGK